MSESKLSTEEAPAGPSKVSGRKGRAWLLKAVAVAAFAYCAAAGYMYLNQRSFVFVPSGTLAAPSEKGLSGISVERVPMSDGTEVVVWSMEPGTPGAPTVLYFHGNSQNVSTRWKRFKQIIDSGYGLYAPGYRGYPGSEGTPSEQGLISDGLEHFDKLAASGTGVILHGESLGTGVAAAVAAERPGAKLLVMEAPYTALVDMAAEAYPWLPVSFLMKDQMRTRERIAKVEAPVLVLHGTEDKVIPVDHGRQLYALANAPKQLQIVEGAGHSDLWANGLWETVQKAYRQGF